jgi:ferrous iron transport protein B
MEITDRPVLLLNLMDEARRHGLTVDARQLSRDLGGPVVPTAARSGQGMAALLQAIADVAGGRIACRPHRLANEPPAIKHALNKLVAKIQAVHPQLPNARWVALRLLGGDERMAGALAAANWAAAREWNRRQRKATGHLRPRQRSECGSVLRRKAEEILQTADRLRREITGDLLDTSRGDLRRGRALPTAP